MTTTAQQLLSLSIMGGLTLAIAPLAGAQGPLLGLDADSRAEIRTELEACRDNNDAHEDRKACVEAVFSANGITTPQHRGRGQKMGHKFRSNISETCGERDNTDEWRECAKEARGTLREQFQEKRPRALNRFQNRRRHGGIGASANLRAELRACLEIDDNEELRECVFGVRKN